MMISFHKKYVFKQLKNSFSYSFWTGNITCMLAPFFDMICKIIWTVIYMYVKMVPELYISCCWIWRKIDEFFIFLKKLQEMSQLSKVLEARDMNDAVSFYIQPKYQYDMMLFFFNLRKKKAYFGPYRIWSFIYNCTS